MCSVDKGMVDSDELIEGLGHSLKGSSKDTVPVDDVDANGDDSRRESLIGD